MSKILKSILFHSSFLVCYMMTCCGQNNMAIPKEFKETPIPKKESKEWFKLNYSKNDFKVNIVNNKLVIEKNTEKTRECRLETKSGIFSGTDHGEWGGQLTFIPNDSQNTITIKKGNIKFIFLYKGKVYFIEGFAHMGINEGTIYEVNTKEHNLPYKKVVDFDDAAQAFTIYKDKLLIAAYKNFYIVKDFKKEIVFKNTFWQGLYPNSIAAFNNENVFIGIRSGIVKLDLTKKTLKFYKNAK
ncbi:hypothetical protein [Flavobacterium gelatinilyticum]|uniref:hypothetical protein n=1 Tax=Flavobacterium gelatinilyticum TaxID=3003260 RepID=UPI002480BC62|nr:hypothetical protein [Flavobacterium gelatinilyticum]